VPNVITITIRQDESYDAGNGVEETELARESGFEEREAASGKGSAHSFAYAKFALHRFAGFWPFFSSRCFCGQVSHPSIFRLAPRSDARFAIQRDSRAYERRMKRLAARLYDAYVETLAETPY
jgi:hypothetical protein